MNWSDFYLFCFLVGFLFSLASLVSGHFHLDGHGHGVHGGHGHGSMFGHGAHGHAGHHHGGAPSHAHDAGRPELSAFNMGTIAAFLAWFGGTGYLATHFYRVWVLGAFALAVAAGLTGAAALFLFVSKVLMRGSEALDPAAFEMVGVLGVVSGSIREGGLGEIIFSQNGMRRAVPVRSEDGTAIPTGVEVVVTEYREGIGYVRRWDELTRAERS